MPARWILTLILLLTAAASPAAQLPGLPPPLTPDLPVSRGELTSAAGAQRGPIAASNGELTLVVWSDERSGTAAFAARATVDGTPLDPVGIPLGATSAGPLVWNGESFSVLTADGSGNQSMVFVAADGSIAGRKSLDLPANLRRMAVGGDGASARFLFISQRGETTVLDAKGNLINATSFADRLGPGESLASVIAAPAGRGFQLLLSVNPARAEMSAVRLDELGRVASWAPSSLRFDSSEAATLSAEPDGFVLITRSWLDSSIAAYRLDANGVYTGISTIVASPRADSDYSIVQERSVAVAWTGSSHLLVWRERGAAGHWFLRQLQLGTDLSSPGAGQVRELVGTIEGVALVRDFAQPLLFTSAWEWPQVSETDLWVQRLSPGAPDGFTAPRVVTFSAPRQLQPRLATSRDGYAVAWTEVGADRFVHGFVRRFTRQGSPYDLAPLEFVRSEAPADSYAGAAQLIATRDSYAVAWRDRTSGTMRIKRLGAAPDSWLDPEPIPLPLSSGALFATDGDDLMAFDSTPCGTPDAALCVATRTISLGSTAGVGPPVIIARTLSSTRYSAAFNGSEYLLVWTEANSSGVICTCPAPDVRLLAMRVRRDGTAIDREPLVLDGWEPGIGSPAVAWDGVRWVVAWVEWLQVSATSISREGAVGPTSVLQLDTTSELPTEVALFPRRAGVAVVTRVQKSAPGSTVRTALWQTSTFAAGSPLDGLAAAPRTTLLSAEERSATSPSLAAATRDDDLIVAFDGPGDRAAGFVQRVFSRVYAELSRRRSANR